jgi:hypothetical protein
LPAHTLKQTGKTQKKRKKRAEITGKCRAAPVFRLQGPAVAVFQHLLVRFREALIYSIENSPTMLAQSVLL